MNKKTIDIIGAGISGLATAYYLSKLQKNIHIRLWETDENAGGLAGTFKIDKDLITEKFYHHIFNKDKALIDLLEELGLGNKLIWNEASNGSYYFDQPYRLSTPLDLLKFKPLPFISRLKMGYMVFIARFIKDWKKLDQITAKAFIKKTGGSKVLKTVWEPLLEGKFGKYAERISAAWIWSKFVDRGGSRNKKGNEVLGYLRGGYHQLFETMIAELIANGHEIFLNQQVIKLNTNSKNQVESIQLKNSTLKTDIVVSAVQTPDLIKILPEGYDKYKHSLSKIEFLANVCLVLVLRESLSKFYWTNVMDVNAPFVGIIEQTQWIDKKDYNDKHVVYISAYVTQQDTRLNMNARELLDFYFPYIVKIFPKFTINIVEKSAIWTAPYTQPIIQVGYNNLVPAIESPINNLYVCTMAQIYPSDRQLSNGVEMAIKTAEIIQNRHFQS